MSCGIPISSVELFGGHWKWYVHEEYLSTIDLVLAILLSRPSPTLLFLITVQRLVAGLPLADADDL